MVVEINTKTTCLLGAIQVLFNAMGSRRGLGMDGG